MDHADHLYDRATEKSLALNVLWLTRGTDS